MDAARLWAGKLHALALATGLLENQDGSCGLKAVLHAPPGSPLHEWLLGAASPDEVQSADWHVAVVGSAATAARTWAALQVRNNGFFCLFKLE